MFDISGQPRGRGIVRAPGPWLLIVLPAGLAMPSLAQDGTGPAPENAQDRRHGGGCDCDPGYRIADGTCVALDMPANAYPTGRSSGTGRACLHGYREVRGATCEPVAIPANAFLHASDLIWNCERGYRKQADACAVIDVPETRISPTAGSERDGNAAAATLPRPVPAFPSSFPKTRMRRTRATAPPRFASGASSRPTAAANRSLSPQGPVRTTAPMAPAGGARGYEARKTSCVTIDLPENAHLDRSGNRWQCNRGFQLSEGNRCILTR